MSEEQVSRCHTHSGVAESTMCVSQWLTCSWRVTGRRGPPAARRHRSARSEGRDATPPGLGGGSPPGVGPLSRGAALPAPSPRARPVPSRPVPSRPVAHLRPAAAQLHAPRGRRRRRQLLLLPRPGPRRAPRPLAPPPSAPANRRSARPPAGHAPAPGRPMASQAPPPGAVPPRRPPLGGDSGGRGAFASARPCCGEEPFVPVEPPAPLTPPRRAPLPLSLSVSPHAGPANSPSSARGEPPSPPPRPPPPLPTPPAPARPMVRSAGPGHQGSVGAHVGGARGVGGTVGHTLCPPPPSPRRGR